jgi:hypothetical protein
MKTFKQFVCESINAKSQNEEYLEQLDKIEKIYELFKSYPNTDYIEKLNVTYDRKETIGRRGDEFYVYKLDMSAVERLAKVELNTISAAAAKDKKPYTGRHVCISEYDRKADTYTIGGGGLRRRDDKPVWVVIFRFKEGHVNEIEIGINTRLLDFGDPELNVEPTKLHSRWIAGMFYDIWETYVVRD